jgi:hypothetical protein
VNIGSAYFRIGTGAVVLAVIVLVVLIGGPEGPEDPSTPASEPTSSSAPTAKPSPVSTEDFCAAFTAMAAAHANHLANDTEDTLLEVTAAAETVRRLAPGTVMPPEARQGLEDLVDGVVEEATAAPDQLAADALSDFLEVSCPAGAA